jgi:hypothetical protein
MNGSVVYSFEEKLLSSRRFQWIHFDSVLAEKNEKDERRKISEVSDHFFFIFRVLLAATHKTFGASRLTGQIF